MRPRIALLMLLVLALLVGLVGTLWPHATARVPSQDVTPPRLIPNTDVNPYGANFFLAREVELWKREKTLQMAQEAGIGWAKQHFPWEAIEPRRKGEFVDEQGRSTWQTFDEIVSLYEKYGLEVIARLDRPPDWTRQDNRFKERPPDNFEDYGDFVYEFVKRYQGRVRYVQIWNEPNIFPEWGDQPVDPASYVKLLKIAYQRAKEADPNVYVLSAPLAITLEDFPGRRNLSDLVFLEEMYQAGAADYFDILSANAFGMDQPPEAPPDPQVLNFRRVELQRQIMERYGDGDKPIWFNEYGWNAAPEDFPPEKLIWKRVSEPEQALYTVRGIEFARKNWPWAGVVAIWYFRQVGNIPPDRADYYFRMVDVDFTPRLVYQTVQEAAASQRVAGPGHFQESNPAVQADRGWRPVIAPQASAEAVLESDVPGATLRFTFQGEEVDLITWRGPEAGRLQVKLDGQPVSQLPTDEKGDSYRELYAPAQEWQVRLPLVRDAGPGTHTLELTVMTSAHPKAAGRRCAVDAFVVGGTPGARFPTSQVIGLLAGLVAVGVLLAREVSRSPGPQADGRAGIRAVNAPDVGADQQPRTEWSQALADLVPQGVFVGTSLILRQPVPAVRPGSVPDWHGQQSHQAGHQSNRLLYGIRPPRLEGPHQVIELTGIGGRLEDQDESLTAGVLREAWEEMGCGVRLLPCRETVVVRGPDRVERVVLAGEERPAAVVFRHHHTPPHQPWHEDHRGKACLVVFLAELAGEPRPSREHPALIWLTPAQVVETARQDVPLGRLLESGAELVEVKPGVMPRAAWARLTDSQEALVLALGDDALGFYEELAGE